MDPVDKSRLPHVFKDSTCNTVIHFIVDEKNGGFRQEEWSRDGKAGDGGFGQVWREVLRDGDTKTGLPANDKFRAVKEIPKTEITDQLLKRELKAIVNFSRTKYRNLFVKSYGWFETQSAVYIAMEYLEKGDLSRYLKHSLPIVEVKEIAVQILKGLYHMHEEGFTHRDLKPANLLVVTTQPWQVKIADFGLCKQVLGDSTSLRTDNGTVLWRAPEYCFLSDPRVKLTNTVDIWSFGAITFNMLTGKQPFLDVIEILEYEKGNSNLLESDFDSDKFGTECVGFLKRTMAPKQGNRMRVYDCLVHPWLKAHREYSHSLTPGGTAGSSSTSNRSPDDLNKFSQDRTSEVGSDINHSFPSGNWSNVDRNKSREVAELAMRNTINGPLKSSTSPPKPKSYGGTARESEITIRPAKGRNVPIPSTERSSINQPENPSYPRGEYDSSDTRSSFRDTAAMLYHKGQWQDLVDQMHDLIEIIGSKDPEFSECLGIMGLALLFCSGREKRAEVILRRAKEYSKESRHAGLNYLLARAYFRQNKHDQGNAHLRQASRDLWQESNADQELSFEEGYHLGVILLQDSKTKSEGVELLKHLQEECFSKLPEHPVGLKASAALNSHRG